MSVDQEYSQQIQDTGWLIPSVFEIVALDEEKERPMIFLLSARKPD